MSLIPKRLSIGKEIRLTGAEFRQLRDLIYAHSGIYVEDRRRFLMENRLIDRVLELGLTRFGEYYDFLRLDKSREREVERLMEMITTNETSFFRDGPQLAALRDDVLPAVFDRGGKSGKRSLTIWSAGCSSGEEPYTLAIMVRELLGRELPRWRIRIMATDISSEMLAKARAGVYDEYSLRAASPEIREKYFVETEKGFRIDRETARMVGFARVNLSRREEMRRVPRSDIIFCRNVIIYFDKEMKKIVANGFYDNLTDGGALFLGHCESLHALSRVFRPVHHKSAVSYVKT